MIEGSIRIAFVNDRKNELERYYLALSTEANYITQILDIQSLPNFKSEFSFDFVIVEFDCCISTINKLYQTLKSSISFSNSKIILITPTINLDFSIEELLNIDEILINKISVEEFLFKINHLIIKNLNTAELNANKNQIESDLRALNDDLLTTREHLNNANVKLELQNIKLEEQKFRIEQEKKKSEELLLNILPYNTAEELKTKGYASARHYKFVSVLFTDFKDFTISCEKVEHIELVNELDTYFSEFDELIQPYHIEKIKTIGDSYMCAGGLPLRNKSNPIDIVLIGLRIQKFMKELNRFKYITKVPFWELRIGVHTGPVIAGVVGKKKYAYDIWGDTVNIASRMESAGEVGKVNISGTTYEYIKDYFDCTYRGKINAKNKGEVDMYFVDGIKIQYAYQNDVFIPNEKFLKLIEQF